MKKKLCMTTYVFGDKYKYYIPLFIYSIKKNYPEYGVVVFCQGELNSSIKKQLKKLESLGDFTINENKFNEIEHDIPRGAALRWLLWDESFNNYDSIYIADIDIFYCKEEIGIYEQHKKHSELIGYNFSNIVRKIEYNGIGKIKRFLRDIKWCGVEYAIVNLFKTNREMKLTGLHFHNVSHYKNKILPLHGEFINKITSKKNYIYGHSAGFNDESFLYDIINKVENGDSIPIATSNKNMLENTCSNEEFRPHHGVHLGIFRDDKQINKNQDILNLEVYKNYAREFQSSAKSEDYKYLESLFHPDLKKEINLFRKYYDI